MFKQEVIVKNKIGLHARPAAKVVAEGNKFKSDMRIKKGDKEVNMKSLLGVLSIGAMCGDVIAIEAEGEDEVAAVEAVTKLIETLE
ncbi:HPr family phosphocarrier protein [Clostridium sp. UBA4548]|uniref:HPr family phosphocarrier protein n=1 Tax=Clostridium sp. UBA4548 TaxID=1946361 RepID=UPI0025C525C4|nr:HPr family phosphocarrier protein [Clostridium sp. UBA4548]